MMQRNIMAGMEDQLRAGRVVSSNGLKNQTFRADFSSCGAKGGELADEE